MDVEPSTNMESNCATIELVDGIMFLHDSMITYADDIDLTSSYSTSIPIYGSEQGCIVWQIKSNNPMLKNEIDHLQYHLGLFWKCTESTDGQSVKNTIAYVFTSEEAIVPEETQFLRIMTHMDATLLRADSNKYTYTLPSGERFGITIEISDDFATNIYIKLYQESDLVRNGNANSFTSLDDMLLHLLKRPYG
jgi:hypothetical protein